MMDRLLFISFVPVFLLRAMIDSSHSSYNSGWLPSYIALHSHPSPIQRATHTTMASYIAKRRLLLVALSLVLAIPASAGRRPVHLRFYMHDIVGGPGQTAVRVVKGPGPPHPSVPGSYFGDTAAIDDLLTEGTSLESKAVGRAQGTYMLSSMEDPVLVVSMTVVLTEGPYNGSTIVVAGRDDTSEEVRELAVVGGTGQLRRASGHLLWRTAKFVSPLYMLLQLDVYATVPSSAAPARGHYWPVVSNRNISAASADS